MALSAEERRALEEASAGVAEEESRRTVDVVDRMSRNSPDNAAENIRLSEETGMPPSAIDQNKAEIHRKEKLRILDGLSARAPLTNEWLSRDKNAVVAHDDISNLEEIERLTRKRREEVTAFDIAAELPAGALEGMGMGISGLGQAYDAYSRVVNRLFHTKDIDEWLRSLNPDAYDTASRITHATIDFGRSLRWGGGKLKEGADEIDLTQEEREGLSYWQNVGVDTVRGTGQLAGQILGYMVAGPTAGTAQIIGQGADQAAERQIQSGTLGKSWSTELGIFTGAAITAGTEKVGIDKLLERIPPNIKNKILRNATDLFIAGGIEALQEVSEGILHGLNEYWTSNPDAEIFDGLDREALAAGGSAIIMRSIINMITPGRAGTEQGDPELRAAFKESNRQLAAASAQDALDQRIHLAQASKVNKRAREQYAEFVQKVAPDEYVFVRPDVLADIRGLADNIVEQIDGTGANVSIPMRQFLTEIATDGELLERLRPHITMRDGDMTQQELADSEETVPEHITRLVEKARQHEDDLTEADQIYQDVKDQLIATHRQGEATARLSAQLIPSMIVAHKSELAKMGKEVTVQQLYEDMGLKIVGPVPEFGNRKIYEQDMLAEQDGKVGYKPERIDFILRENAYSGDADRSKGAVAYINPAQFLDATTPSEIQRQRVREETDPLNTGSRYEGVPNDISKEIQTPFLDIVQDPDTGEWSIDGHEGRHRMVALANAGYNQVPVVLKFDRPRTEVPVELQEAGLLLGDTWNGESAKPIEVYGATTLSWANKGKIAQDFGIGSGSGFLFQSNGMSLEQRFIKHQNRLDVIDQLRDCLNAA